jgi:hypothetical protein
MANPLAGLVETEDREDGVYIKVNPGTSDVTVDKLEAALRDACVVNYDIEHIALAVTRAKGVFERIGPPFEFYDPEFENHLKVQIVSPMKATMRVSSEAIVAGMKITEKTVRYGLARVGIRFGLLDEAIKKFLVEAAYDTDIVIAEGLPPGEGVDGKIEVQVNLHPDAAPKVDESGRTDFRQIQTFVEIKKGQPLAKRIPPCQGTPGINVQGEDIPSAMGNDVRLPAGKNTDISADGQWLTAAKEGVVYLENGLICVGEMLTIPGDVDFSVGNIKYSGNVIVRGNVRPGFIVESEGDIEIQGEVESAKVISRKGSVTIAKGVIGRDDTEIFAASGITVSFAQGCILKTDGTLTVEKYLLHCAITCSVLDASKQSSGVYGGTLTVYDHVTAYMIGNDSNVETLITLVDKNRAKAKEKLDELKEVREKIVKQLDPVTRELKTKSAMLKKIGHAATDRQRQELKKWVDAYNSLNMKVKYIDKKEEEIQAIMNSSANFNGYIKVLHTIYPGTKLDMYGISHKDIKTLFTSKTFKLMENQIQAEG